LVAVGSNAKAKRWSADAAESAGAASSKLEFNGKIREVAASADPLTRTYQAKLSLDADVNVPLGSTVYVLPSNPLAGAQAIKLPTSSLMQSAQGVSQVWLLDKATMQVNATNVQVATADGNEAVIASGLKAGDLVVSSGIHVLSPGLKVSIFNEKGAQAQDNRAPAATKTIANQPQK
jgi:membrane fusion protein, multidrug efflux system